MTTLRPGLTATVIPVDFRNAAWKRDLRVIDAAVARLTPAEQRAFVRIFQSIAEPMQRMTEMAAEMHRIMDDRDAARARKSRRKKPRKSRPR